MFLTALTICPVVANSEMIAVGVGVSVEIGDGAEVAVTLAEGEILAGVVPVPGVEVLVGVNVGEVAGSVVGDAVGAGAGARLARAII